MNRGGASDIGRGLVETAKRVLPGGTFGNVPGEVVISEGRGGYMSRAHTAEDIRDTTDAWKSAITALTAPSSRHE